MRAIGLLCGVGSLLREAQDAGYDVVGNVESRGPYATALDLSWAHNFPDAPFHRKLLEDDGIPDEWFGADIALGHPPCGSHSTLGNSGARTDSMGPEARKKFFAERDADMGLLPQFIHYVNLLEPKAFALDNLPKIMRTSAPPEWWQTMLPKYHLTFVVMRNWDYGVPQRRERLWVIGVHKKHGTKFDFKAPRTRLDGPATLLAALDGLPWQPWINEPESGHVHVEPNVMLTADYRTTIKNLRVTRAVELASGFLSIPTSRAWPYLADSGRIARKIGRLRPDLSRHAPVVTGLPSIHHPLTGWPLTARERARLMRWPDDFVLGTSETTYDRYALMRLILFTGKAVPAGFVTYLLPQLKKHLKRGTR
jgi:site-specific DNA-cytosine methylase